MRRLLSFAPLTKRETAADARLDRQPQPLAQPESALAGGGDFPGGLPGMPGGGRPADPRHAAAVRHRRAGRRRRPGAVAGAAARLCRRAARRPAVLRAGPALPPEHPAPARPAPASRMADQRRAALPALRRRQPAAGTLHRPAAPDAADARRHAGHALPALLADQRGGRRRLVSRLSAAGLGHRRSLAPAAAGGFLAVQRGDRRRIGPAAGLHRAAEPAPPAPGHPADRLGQRAVPGGADDRLALAGGLRSGPAGAGTERAQRRAGPRHGADHPAR